VIIGEGCKIYNNTVILPGVELGKHCVVGANSVVLEGVYPDFCIIVGSPAKIIKQYCFISNNWIKNGVN
jgi:acetyltransferase-like isoleucine patch superfamily enzyme